MPGTPPPDPHFETRTRASFARQAFMSTIGATLHRVDHGAVEIRLPFRQELTQQHRFIHAGAIAAIADSACGYAAFSMMPSGVGVLSIEYKINLLRPATGEMLIARARVIRAGRTITVCQADVVAVTGPEERTIAVALATIMTIRDQPGIEG